MPFKRDPARNWETFAKENPYFSVLTEPKYLNANLNDDSLREFFASGEKHIEHVYEAIQNHVRPDFKPSRVLDYGCGVGRLVVPLAKRASLTVRV